MTAIGFYLFAALMIYAAVSDLLTMKIPNRISLALIALFPVVALIGGMSALTFLLHLGAGFAVLVVCYGLFAMNLFGGGDAKLAAATALWLGFGSLLDYLLLSALIGGGLSIGLLLMRSIPLPGFALGWGWLVDLHKPRGGVPYGIALAAGGILAHPQSPLLAMATT